MAVKFGFTRRRIPDIRRSINEFLGALLDFTRVDNQSNSDFRERVKVTNIVDKYTDTNNTGDII
jgi:hypothetical protein